MNYKKLYKNWWMHNIVAHPLFQIVKPFSKKTAEKIHNSTLPMETK